MLELFPIYIRISDGAENTFVSDQRALESCLVTTGSYRAIAHVFLYEDPTSPIERLEMYTSRVKYEVYRKVRVSTAVVRPKDELCR